MLRGLLHNLKAQNSGAGISRYHMIALVAAISMLYPLLDRSVPRVDMVTNAFIYVLMALGMNIILGYAGLLCLGYAAFFATGAYTCGVLSSNQFHPAWSELFQPLASLGLVSQVSGGGAGPDVVLFHFSFWLVLPLAGLLAALLGVVFGGPAIRVRAGYLAVVTIGLGEMVPVLILNLQSITGGAMGLTGVNSPSIFGYRFGLNPVPYYYLLLFLVLLTILVCYHLQDSRIGRGWRAIQQDEQAAVCMGVDKSGLKVLAFSIGATLGGLAGAVYASKLTTASPEAFTMAISTMLVVIVVLGGKGSIPGVVIAGLFLSLLQSVILPSLGDRVHALGYQLDIQHLQTIRLIEAMPLFFGLILVTVIIYRPEGLIPFLFRVTSLAEEDVKVEPIPGRRISLTIRSPSEVSRETFLLKTVDLTKHFGGIHALESLDVEVKSGDILGMIGPNGSGKTTFFNVLTGLETPDKGKIKFLNEEIQGLPGHVIASKGISRSFQTLHLFPDMTVLENLLVGQHALLDAGLAASVLRTPGMRAEEKEAREWAMEVLGIFGNRLLPRVDHPAISLSYANRRRLEIARALAGRPRLLLLDEPTAGMNPAETLEIMDQLSGLPDVGVTTIIIEHKLQVVTAICNRVIALDHGMKIAEGSPDEVRNDAAVLEAYLGRAPTISASSV